VNYISQLTGIIPKQTNNDMSKIFGKEINIVKGGF